jgi:hypothetical protein
MGCWCWESPWSEDPGAERDGWELAESPCADRDGQEWAGPVVGLELKFWLSDKMPDMSIRTRGALALMMSTTIL